MTTRTLLLTALAMLAFAGNSILCRIALRDTAIDPASFTGLRIVAGALTLWLLLRVDRADQPLGVTGSVPWRCSSTRPAFPLPISTWTPAPAHCCCSVPYS